MQISKINRMVLTTGAILSLVAVAPLIAQQVAPALSTLSGLQGTIGVQAGNYNFKSYDKSSLQKQYIDIFKENQAADKAYVIDSAAKVEVAFKELIELRINGDAQGQEGLQTLSDNSQSKKPIPVDQYLSARRRYNNSVAALKTKITSITALPSAMPKSEAVTLEESGIVNMREVGKVDFTSLLAYYNGQLETINNTVSNLEFNLILPNGAPLAHVKGDIKIQSPYTQDEINAMIDEETRLRNPNKTDLQLALKQHNLKTRAIMDAFIDAYGTSQTGRFFDHNDIDKDATLKQIDEAMWSRDYLRATTGVQVGALGVDYKKRLLNVDIIFAKNEPNFTSEYIFDQEILVKQRDLIMTALKTYDRRDDSVFASDISLLTRVLSGITFAMGKAQLAQVHVAMLKMMYADIVSELNVAQNGLSGAREQYQLRWYKSTEDQKAVKDRAADWTGKSATSILTTDARNIRGTFTIARQALKKRMLEIDLADQKRAAIDAFSSNGKVNSLEDSL